MKISPAALCSDGVRIDKWLWAARFFKTRALAVAAIERQRISVNGVSIKASKLLRGGELMRLQVAEQQYEIEVLGLSEKRGAASVARLLYRETPSGAKARIDALERRRLAPEPAQQLHGRPSKQDRRALTNLKEQT